MQSDNQLVPEYPISDVRVVKFNPKSFTFTLTGEQYFMYHIIKKDSSYHHQYIDLVEKNFEGKYLRRGDHSKYTFIYELKTYLNKFISTEILLSPDFLIDFNVDDLFPEELKDELRKEYNNSITSTDTNYEYKNIISINEASFYLDSAEITYNHLHNFKSIKVNLVGFRREPDSNYTSFESKYGYGSMNLGYARRKQILNSSDDIYSLSFADPSCSFNSFVCLKH